MKRIKNLLIKEDIHQDINPAKFAALIRMGLISPSKLTVIKRALEKNNPGESLSPGEKGALKELVDSLIDQVMNNPMIYNQVKRNLIAVNEELNGEQLELLDEANNLTAMSDFPKIDRFAKGDINQDFPNDRMMPSVLIMKRKAIRIYPDNQKVALYYIQALDKYVTIPFGNVLSVNEEKKNKKKFYIDERGIKRRAMDTKHPDYIEWEKENKKANGYVDPDWEVNEERKGSMNGVKVSFPWKNKDFDTLHKKLDPHSGGTTIKDHNTMHWHWSFLTPEEAENKGKEVAKTFSDHGIKHDISYYSGINEEKKDNSYGEGHPDHNDLVISAINNFSQGVGHPVASPDNLHAFQKPFVRKMLNLASKHVKPEHADRVKKAVEWLGEESINEVSKELATRAFLKRAAQAYDFGDDDSIEGVEKRVKAAYKLDKQHDLFGKSHGARYKAGTENPYTGSDGELNHVRPWANNQAKEVVKQQAFKHIKNEIKRRKEVVNDTSRTKLDGVRQKVSADPIQGGWEGVGDLAVRGVAGVLKLGYKGVSKVGNKLWNSKPKSIAEESINEAKSEPVSHYHFTYDKGDVEGEAKVAELRKQSKGTHIVKLRGRGSRKSMKDAGYSNYAAQSYVPKSHAERFAVYTYPRDTQNMNRAVEKQLKNMNNMDDTNAFRVVQTKPENQYKFDKETGRRGFTPPRGSIKEEKIREKFREKLDEALPLVALGVGAAVRAVAGAAVRAAPVVGRTISRGLQKIGRGAKKTGKVLAPTAIQQALSNNNNNNSNAESDLGLPKSVVQGKEFSGDRLAGVGASVSGQRKGPSATTQGDFISPTQAVNYRKQMVTPTQRMYEQVDFLRKSIEHGLNEIEILVGEDSFKINNNTAKKILEVYDSVNKKNKKKMAEMLSESKESFDKIINFAQDYTKRS